MITSTSNPRLWRIEVDAHSNDLTKTGLVCYLRIMDNGIQLYYSHHVMYSRSIPKGPWMAGTRIQQPLNPILKSTILIGVMPEVWETACLPDVMRWPGEPDQPIEENDFGN